MFRIDLQNQGAINEDKDSEKETFTIPTSIAEGIASTKSSSEEVNKSTKRTGDLPTAGTLKLPYLMLK